MGDNRGDELDRVIDRALRAYASAGPLDGLEQRVIERVHTQTRARGHWWFRAAVAIPALAALIMVITLARLPRKPEAAANVPNAKAPVAAAVRQREPAAEFPRKPEFRLRTQGRADRVKTLRRPATGMAAVAKQEQFPAPAPMTREERALIAWTSRTPGEVMSAFADLRKRADEPVSVQEIRLPPLPGDGAK